ncbi:MAG: nucleoside phosphorylase [Bacteroidetes bacterium]|jgi:uridine phosphorylase|nr:nucleoside phosphorylase [Bacteroidota bacterium]
MKERLAESELVLNPDNSIYHLKLHPEQIAHKIIVVGDQARVATVSDRFDSIEHRVQNREFITHTGRVGSTRITALSTGIGTDNIDIVLNELDALVNIELTAREIKNESASLEIIRIGTSGALHADIPVDSFVASSYGMGFDGLLNYYAGMKHVDEPNLVNSFMKHAGWLPGMPYPYTVAGSDRLLKQIAHDMTQGITATAPGFYGPQGRQLRLAAAKPDLNELLGSYSFNGHRITNFEMETSALYGLGKMLGHDCMTVCAIIANRAAGQYSKNYKPVIAKLIDTVIERFVV